MLNWSEILEDLVQGLEWRLQRAIPTTEDTARYYFYLRLMKAGIRPGTMILERSHPHPQLQQKEIDLSVIRRDGMWDFEIKYHRPIPSGRNRPLTRLRGQVVSDLYKLALSDGQRRYLLYLADPKMADHWKRQEERLISAKRTLPLALTKEWLAGQPATLRGTVRGGIGFLPEQVVPSVWVEASWSGTEIESWLLGVD